MSVFKSMFGRRTFRQSLGICQNEPFDENIHGSSRKSCSWADGENEAKNCFVPLWCDVSTIEEMRCEALHRILLIARTKNSMERM